MAKGINNETRGASLKKFKPNPKINGGLSIGALVEVSVSTAEVKEDSNMESFRGMTIPRLNFVFESRMDATGVKKSTYVHSYLPIEHTPESLHFGDGGTAWKWDQMSQTIKHFIDVFRDNRPLTEEEAQMLTVDFVDEQDGVFVPQEPQVVVDAYKKFFDNVVKMFKPADKAIYVDEKGTPRILHMKLLYHIKGKNVNGGDAGFPGYVGEGLIELYIPNVAPSISINIGKGESVEPIVPATAGAAPGGAAAGSTPTAGSVKQADVPDFMRS